MDQKLTNITRIGMEFEFFSNDTYDVTAKKLSKFLGKNIIVPKESRKLNTEYRPSKPKVTPTDAMWLLVPDYSGGPKMKELVTGILNYNDARLVLIQMLSWIKKNGWTSEKTGLHINMSFDEYGIKNEFLSIISLDRLKFCVSFPEEQVYSKFPDRNNNTYTKSIKTIVPNSFNLPLNGEYIDVTNYKTPSTKYFGVNFLKQEKDYLEYRYIGGRDYEEKTQDILDLVDMFTLHLYDCLKNPEYTQTNIIELKNITAKYKSINESYSSLENFLLNYPNIKVFVDLQMSEQYTKTYWNNIRDGLFHLMMYGDFKEGEFNYDTTIGKYQVRAAKLTKCQDVKDFEFYECEVDGIFSNCKFIDCKIKDSHLNCCNLFENNEVEMSKVQDCPIYYTTTLKGCYIENPNDIINGELKDCIIRHGLPGNKAKLINTKIV